MTNLRKFKIVKIISVLSTISIFIFAVTLIFQFANIFTLKTTQNKLKNTLNQLEQDIIAYETENRYMQTDEFIEDYARVVLGYGKPGETRYR